MLEGSFIIHSPRILPYSELPILPRIRDAMANAEEPGRRDLRVITLRRKGNLQALPTLLSLYFVGAGLTFLVCARTFLSFHVFILASTSTLRPIKIHLPGQDSFKFFAPDQIALRVVAEGVQTSTRIIRAREKFRTLEAVSADQTHPNHVFSKHKLVAIPNLHHQQSLIGDLQKPSLHPKSFVATYTRTTEAKTDAGRVGVADEAHNADIVGQLSKKLHQDFMVVSNSKANLQGMGLQEKLHNMSPEGRRVWLQRHWHTFQVLRSDSRSNQFLLRMERFFCGQDDKVSTEVDTPHAQDSNTGIMTTSSQISADSETQDQGAASSKLDSQPKSCQKFQDGGLPPGDGRKSCDQRFFMTWISPVDTFGPRELLALESVFKWHPSACVVIFSRSMDSDGGKKILAPFLARGYRIMAVAPDLTSLFHGTPAERWFQQLKDGLGDPGEINLMQNLSNLMRLVALYKYGGIYLDTDIIVLKSLADLRNVVGAQSIDPDTRQWSRLNNAVLVFDKAHPLVYKFIKEFAEKFDGSKWGYNGPYLVSRVAEKIRDTKEGKSVAVLRPQAFYPVNWNNIVPMFRAPVTETEIKWQELELQRLRDHSYTIHLWNKKTWSLEVEPGSIMEDLFEQSCIFCKPDTQQQAAFS